MDPTLCTAPLFTPGGAGELELNVVGCPFDVLWLELDVVVLAGLVVVVVADEVGDELAGGPAPGAPAALPPATHPSHAFIWPLGTGFCIH